MQQQTPAAFWSQLWLLHVIVKLLYTSISFAFFMTIELLPPLQSPEYFCIRNRRKFLHSHSEPCNELLDRSLRLPSLRTGHGGGGRCSSGRCSRGTAPAAAAPASHPTPLAPDHLSTSLHQTNHNKLIYWSYTWLVLELKNLTFHILNFYIYYTLIPILSFWFERNSSAPHNDAFYENFAAKVSRRKGEK